MVLSNAVSFRPPQVTETAVSNGTDVTHLWKCTAGMNAIHPKDIPSVSALKTELESCVWHISSKFPMGFRLGSGDYKAIVSCSAYTQEPSAGAQCEFCRI